MKHIVKKSQTRKIKELFVSTFYEYPLPFKNLSVGISEINGRYPEKGYEVDHEVEQVWYVELGSGTVWIQDKEHNIQQGDMVLVPKGEKYWIKGNNFRLVVSSSPAWFTAQHGHEE